MLEYLLLNYIFLTGLIGSLVLVTGAAWPIRAVKHPVKSTKNWLFAIGGLTMFMYALLNYFAGGAVFFVFLQILVMVSTILMMLNVRDFIDTIIISAAGAALIIWSLTLFEGYSTIVFILGLIGVGLGYAFKMGTLKRMAALTIGSILIAVFSYIEANWIFFWLNVFFALFSGYYAVRLSMRK